MTTPAPQIILRMKKKKPTKLPWGEGLGLQETSPGLITPKSFPQSCRQRQTQGRLKCSHVSLTVKLALSL
jgi:hypothetical protein